MIPLCRTLVTVCQTDSAPSQPADILYLSPTEIIKDWIVKPLRDQHVKPKAAATFKCELFKDTPNWKWLKGETEVTASDKVEIKKDGKELTLTIKNCQPEDVAEYAMEVEGRIYTAKLTLGGSSFIPSPLLTVLPSYFLLPSCLSATFTSSTCWSWLFADVFSLLT